MTVKLFGTDGIRGTSNTEPMTAETALRVGMAAAVQFVRGDHRHQVVIGKDTRLSGYLLEPALTAGFISMGMDVVLVGPIPTPAVAMLTRSLRADLGVMISASHNPYEDNGIKLFGPDGFKLSDADEVEIEARVNSDMTGERAGAANLGHARRLDDVRGRYNEYVKQTFPRGLRLDGLKVAVDCANGAAYKAAPEVLWELGAEVVPIGVDPDGFNINKGCGSIDTDYMRSLSMAHSADMGLALDGDADRMLAVDAAGDVVDGDQVLAILALAGREAGSLVDDTVVATVMSNLGFVQAMEAAGITVATTKVGDRYVLEQMRASGFVLGGEQSGHVIMSRHATTGDGLMAGLQFLAAMTRTGRSASDLANNFDPVPQMLKNVRFGAGQLPLETDGVKAAIASAETELNGKGRLLIRKSGTEPLIRVMAECEDPAMLEAVVDRVVEAVQDVV